MTDEEIIQYLDIIEPVYTDRMKASLSGIHGKTNEIDGECKRLNMLIHSPPSVEIIDQETWNKEQERKTTIKDQLKILQEEISKLQARQQVLSFMAEMQGYREEWKKLKQMPRKQIDDIHKQAEILNILDNRCM